MLSDSSPVSSCVWKSCEGCSVHRTSATVLTGSSSGIGTARRRKWGPHVVPLDPIVVIFCLFVPIGQSQDNEKELAALFQLWLETKDQAFCKVCCENLPYDMLLKNTSSRLGLPEVKQNSAVH